MSQTLTDHMNGRGVRFQVDDKAYALRAPQWFEQDDAEYEMSVATRNKRMFDPRILALSNEPAPEEELLFLRMMAEHEARLMNASGADAVLTEEQQRKVVAMEARIASRTAADKPLEEYSVRVRSRKLAELLLIDGDTGEPLVFSEQSIPVQNTATEAGSEIWSNLNDIPFLSGQPEEQV